MALLCWMTAASALWLLLTVGPAYVDARHLGAGHRQALRLAMSAALRPLSYWYDERLRLLPPEERARLRAWHAERLGLQQINNVHCPLCGTEIQQVWVLGSSGRLAVHKGPVVCSACDFRLDSCRHCAHFKQGIGIMHSHDSSHGHCTFYKTVQPVEELCPREVAQRLQQRGYTHLSGPTRVTDSYVPLDTCSAFVLDERRLRSSGVKPPSRRCRGLLEGASNYASTSVIARP